MSPPWFAAAGLSGAALILALTALLWRELRREERLAERLAMVRDAAGPLAPRPANRLPLMLRIVTAAGEGIAYSGLLSARTLEALRQTLETAGFRGRHVLGMFVGAKLLLLALLPLTVLLLPWLAGTEVPHQGGLAALAAVAGLLAPDQIVRYLRRRYLSALESGLPDALDMMVICGQAGLGMEVTIERVAEEIVHAHPEVAGELSRAAREMQVNADIKTALNNLGRRTGLESLNRLASVLNQSMQYGTPLTQALRTLSAEQRQETLVKFEARAGRLPVLLTLPMIVFVLPCVFLVIAGPVMVDIYRAMAH